MKESVLECIFKLLTDYKILMRFNSVTELCMKSLCMMQEGEDPPLLSLFILPSQLKNKDDYCYPACTFRDKNTKICHYFFCFF